MKGKIFFTKKRTIYFLIFITIFPLFLNTVIREVRAVDGTPDVRAFVITHYRGDDFVNYFVSGFGWDEVGTADDVVVHYTLTNFTTNQYGQQYDLDGNSVDPNSLNNYTFSVSNDDSSLVSTGSPTYALYNAPHTGTHFYWDVTFKSEFILHDLKTTGFTYNYTFDMYNPIDEYQYVECNDAIIYTWTGVVFSLEPIITIDSEHYNNLNTRIEYTTDGTNWYETTYDSLTLDDYDYKARIYDAESNELIYEDNDYVNFTRIRNIEINSVKLTNNANEPIIFNLNTTIPSQFLVYPYRSRFSNLTDTLAVEYNVTDQYGNYLINNTVVGNFTDYLNLNYTSPEMVDCLTTYSDQQGNYLNWFGYKTRVNGTLIYEPIIQREVGSILNVSVYDRFDNYITSTLHTVTRGDNFISQIITLYSLKIYNQQDSYAYVNLSSTISSAYWSEWVAPDEIIEYRLVSGDYQLNVTKYEETTITSEYDYTLVGDDILLINSQYTLLLLSKIHQMSVFSDLVNWTDVYDDLSQIALYDFVNSFSEQNVRVYLRYEGSYDSIVVGAGDVVSQILPSDTIADIDYRVMNEKTGEFVTDWISLPDNKTIDIGFYDTTIPATPDDLKTSNINIWVIVVSSIVFFAVFGFLYIRLKAQTSPQKSLNRKLFMDEKTINNNVKKAKRRGGFYNLKGTMD